ncbi:hypothetical protein HYN48_10455 [Flavobacterium magnum]|uniref:Uncharacterized protein n=1 Tax=Flavobacterium magnum TaxID=2162713 RepID=A0A2S0RFD8_9FLAO|nr:hypothetical protein [Flavobacterium magnum]AWA30473.1 hypothetical protein HYN48_10455 [Flavobacterium magnum]
MKKILLSAMMLFGLNAVAQNKNITNVTKTTVTTVKDSDGEKKQVKKENVQEVQNIELQNAESKELNKDLKPTPVEVTSTTQITNPDGSTRTVDVDRSSYYESNGVKYDVKLDAQGYTVNAPSFQKPALLRKTSTNSYIYRGKDQTSIGYFDTNGNLILETYDDRSDKVSTQTFTKVK